MKELVDEVRFIEKVLGKTKLSPLKVRERNNAI